MTTGQAQRSNFIDLRPVERSWEEVLVDQFQKQTGKKMPLNKIIKSNLPGLMDLWETYTGGRRQLAQGLLSHKRTALTYYLGFHLPNVIRCRNLLARASEQTSVFANWKEVEVVDIGCGTGAMSIAVASALADLAKSQGSAPTLNRISLFDSTGSVLDYARASLENFLEDKSTKLVSARIPIEQVDINRTLESEQPLIITMGYVWNELANNPRSRRVINNLLQRALTRDALVIITEPATESSARKTMELRTELVSNGWHSRYPCPASAASCPMLEKGGDWCYSEFSWERPAGIELVDSLLDINRSTLGCSGYVFSSVPPVKDRGNPIVGRPTRKGQPRVFDYLICEGSQLTKSPKRGGRQILRGETLPI